MNIPPHDQIDKIGGERGALRTAARRELRRKKKALRAANRKVHKAKRVKRQRPQKDKFLSSKAWVTLRYEAIKLYGNKCKCCGKGPDSGAELNVDHIKPRWKFPHLALDITNLQVLCSWCNWGKGGYDETDWRTW
jgi:5-methylcytosine-specific restriction endonuclease McrA